MPSRPTTAQAHNDSRIAPLSSPRPPVSKARRAICVRSLALMTRRPNPESNPTPPGWCHDLPWPPPPATRRTSSPSPSQLADPSAPADSPFLPWESQRESCSPNLPPSFRTKRTPSHPLCETATCCRPPPVKRPTRTPRPAPTSLVPTTSGAALPRRIRRTSSHPRPAFQAWEKGTHRFEDRHPLEAYDAPSWSCSSTKRKALRRPKRSDLRERRDHRPRPPRLNPPCPEFLDLARHRSWNRRAPAVDHGRSPFPSTMYLRRHRRSSMFRQAPRAKTSRRPCGNRARRSDRSTN